MEKTYIEVEKFDKTGVYVTNTEAARLARVHPVTIGNWRRMGLLRPAKKSKGMFLYYTEDVMEIIEKRKKIIKPVGRKQYLR